MKDLYSRREALLGIVATPLSATVWPQFASAGLSANTLHPSLRKLLELQGPVVVIPELSSLIKFQLGPDAWSETPSPTVTRGWNALWVQPEQDTLCLQYVGSFFESVLQKLGAGGQASATLSGLSPQQVIKLAEVCLDQARRAGLFIAPPGNPAVIDEKLLQLLSLIRESHYGNPDPDLCGLDVIFTEVGHFETVIRRSGGRYHICTSPALQHLTDHRGDLIAAKCVRPLLVLERRLRPLPCHFTQSALIHLLHLVCEVKSQAQALSVLSKTSRCTWSGCSSRQDAASGPSNPAQRTRVFSSGGNRAV